MANGKIGNPLVPTERPAEQPRALSRPQAGGVGQISTFVPVQKLNLMSGQGLQQATQARSDLYSELGNMASKVVDAGVYIHEQGELRKKLDYEKKYNELYINSKRDFNSAVRSDEKEAIRNTYETNIAKLNAGIKSQEWNSVKEQAWAQGLEVESKKNLADFTAKFRVTEFNETVTDANAKLKFNADSFRTKENIDPLLQLDRGTQILEDLHKMGALSKPEFLLKVKQYTDKATLDRATLIATNYASGVDAYNMPKTPEDLLVDLQQKLGLSLDSSNIPTVNEAFKTAFMQEINRKNKLNGFREKYINIAFKEENAEINSLLAEKIEAGLVQGNDFEDAKRIAELHGDKVQQRKLRALESNFYNNTQVNPKISDYWTAIGGEGYDHIFNKKNGFKTEGGMIKVKESMDYIRKQDEAGSPDHDGFTRDERTLTSIESSFRKYNATVKNKRVTDTRVKVHVKDFLFRTIDDATQNGQAQAVKNQLLSLLNISPDTLEQSRTNRHATPDAWIDNLVKHNDKYHSITQGLTDEIRNIIATTDVRDGGGVYSTKGFSQDTTEWNNQFRADVIERFKKRLGMDNSKIADHKPSVKETGNTLALVQKKPNSTQPMPDNDQKENAQKILKTQNEIKKKTGNQVNPTVETVAEKLQEHKGNTEKTVKDITSDYQPPPQTPSTPLGLNVGDFEDKTNFQEDIASTKTSPVGTADDEVFLKGKEGGATVHSKTDAMYPLHKSAHVFQKSYHNFFNNIYTNQQLLSGSQAFDASMRKFGRETVAGVKELGQIVGKTMETHPVVEFATDLDLTTLPLGDLAKVFAKNQFEKFRQGMGMQELDFDLGQAFTTPILEQKIPKKGFLGETVSNLGQKFKQPQEKIEVLATVGAIVADEFRNLKNLYAPPVDVAKDFDPKNIGYNPQGGGQVFDPNMVQAIQPAQIVQEVAKAVRGEGQADAMKKGWAEVVESNQTRRNPDGDGTPLSSVHPQLRTLAQEGQKIAFEKHGLQVIFVEGSRGEDAQNKAFKDKLSQAQAGQSAHQYDSAIDFAFHSPTGNKDETYRQGAFAKNENDFRTVAEIFKSLGLVSGFDFSTPDRGHIELSNWENVRDQDTLNWLDKRYKVRRRKQLANIKDTRVKHKAPASAKPINFDLPVSKQTDRTIWDRATYLYDSNKEFQEWGTGKDQTWKEKMELETLLTEIKNRGLSPRKMDK